MKSELIKGDSLQELKKYDDNSIDLLCTDPPYGYSFMGRDWDKTLPPKEIFEECFRVLKPGSMAFVMSAPRSDVQYRMTEMLEKVGFRIDYTPIYWTYASGFPKAMNVSKMLEKNGNQKEELDGSYGGFQPKPAVEVVIVAMKPLDKKGYLEQAQDNGKGITWFDDCRIPFEEGYVEPENQTMPDLRDVGKKSKEAIGIDKLSYGQVQNSKRKPYKSDYQKYVEKQKSFKGSETIGTTIKGNEHFLGGDIEQLDPSENFVDESAGRFPANMLVSDKVLDDYSRYFSLDEWFSKNIESLPEPVQKTFPFMIVPKASKSEKNDGLDNFEEQFKAGADFRPNHKEKALKGEDGNPYGRWNKIKNIHPTVKPLTLMSYLVTLGSRKGDMVLDPFMGSGTTPLACVSLERKYIGIDNEQDYYEIAKARVDKLEQPLKMWEKFS